MEDKGRLFNSAKDKADILNRQYISVQTVEEPGEAIPDPEGEPFSDMNDIAVQEEGVRKLLKKCNPNKASGPDCIPARILRECADEIALILTAIFTSIETGMVPEDWRQANISAVFKKKKSCKLSSSLSDIFIMQVDGTCHSE